MIALKSIDITQKKISTLAIPVCEDKPIHDGILGKLAQRALTFKEFDGKNSQELVLYDLPGLKTERTVFLGLGKFKKIDREKLRQFSGNMVKSCIKRSLKEVFIAAPSDDLLKMDASPMLTALLEGGCLGNHIFDKYKKKKEQKPLRTVNVLTSPDNRRKNSGLASRIATVCNSTLLARDWVSTPANDKRPGAFSRMIVQAAKKEKLNTRVLTEKELRKGKYGAIMAVGEGSQDKPRLVELTYAPKGAKKTIALIGKGVTFDTGGINLKPSGAIEDMKIDMSGAAAVAATLIAVAALKPKIKVVGVIPIVENMPSGTATRPGDIIKSLAGKTIEIGNTDAEGRLILIDAMAHALKTAKPDIMIDIATLTGACMVALGEKMAGLFTKEDDLADAVSAAAAKTHERIWRMPLPDDYRELLKSDFADLNNMSSSKYGGAVTAALFLSEFAGKSKWAHIDIAGPAYIKKDMPYCEVGGTGFGVRLFCELIESLA